MRTLLAALLGFQLFVTCHKVFAAAPSEDSIEFELLNKKWVLEPFGRGLRDFATAVGSELHAPKEFVPDGCVGSTTQYLIQEREPTPGAVDIDPMTLLRAFSLSVDSQVTNSLGMKTTKVYGISRDARGFLTIEYTSLHVDSGVEEYIFQVCHPDGTDQFTVFKRGERFKYDSEKFAENRAKWKKEFLTWSVAKRTSQRR